MNMESSETIIAQRRYSAGAILLHWLIALAIITNWLLAQVAEGASEEREQALMGVHMALGVTILLLSLVRIAWRLTHRPPPPNPNHRAWERLLASVVHKLFYVLMIALPLSGYLMLQTYAGGMGVDMFGLFEFPGIPIAKDESANEVFHELHEVFATMILALFLLHVAGAWKHQLLDRDGTIFRMFPFGRSRS